MSVDVCSKASASGRMNVYRHKQWSKSLLSLQNQYIYREYLHVTKPSQLDTSKSVWLYNEKRTEKEAIKIAISNYTLRAMTDHCDSKDFKQQVSSR